MEIWITDSQDEQSIEALFRDVEQLHIPIFQREYVWGKQQFEDLCRDIELVKEEIEKSQFLGAIVGYEKPRDRAVVGRLKALDIVDGQQRLLTIYLFIMVIAEKIAQFDIDESKEIIEEFLLLRPRKGLSVNTRIVPSFKDRSQFRVLWDKLISSKKLESVLQNLSPSPPLASGNSEGNILKQFARIQAYLRKKMPSTKEEGLKYLQSVLEIVTSKLTFVHLKLNDPSVATKIFQRLNFRGVKVGIVDLVRNDIFSRIDNNPERSKKVFDNVWVPFEKSFYDKAEGFFFPYCLIFNGNIKKSELFTELRTLWHDKSPEEIIKHMIPYQKQYLHLNTGSSNYDHKNINDQVKRFFEMKAPSAINPFIMKTLEQYDSGKISMELTKNILGFVESFLVRRAIVGLEPTGLHAVFKSLWQDIEGNITVDNLRNEILSKPTVQYPTDNEIKNAIENRELAKTKICNFLLVEYDRSLPGDNPSEKPTIEHILPQEFKKNGPWSTSFDEEQHKKYLNILANLIPLSKPLNSSVQTSSFEKKKQRYLAESMFVTPRILSQEFDNWNEESIKKRTKLLQNWAIKRWKY